MQKFEYKVVSFEESGLIKLLFGVSNFSTKKMEKLLNKMSTDGWEMKFQIMEHRRFLWFMRREAIVITFARPVSE